MKSFAHIAFISVVITKGQTVYGQTANENHYPNLIALLDGVIVSKSSIPYSSLNLEVVNQNKVSI